MIQRFPYKLIFITLVAISATLVFIPPWDRSKKTEEPILHSLDVKDIEAISIAIGSGTNKSSVQLTQSNNKKWYVDDKNGNSYEAHLPLIETLLLQLENKWTEIPSPPDASSEAGQKLLKDMELSPAKLTMTLGTKSGLNLVLVFGSKLDGQDFCYISDQNYSSVALAPIELQNMAIQPALYWRKRQVIDLEESPYDSITITSLYGKIGLKKNTASQTWTLATPIKEEADTQEIEKKIRYLSQINAIEYRPKSDSFETTFALRLNFLNEGINLRSYEWRQIRRPEEDPANEGEPPLFILTESISGSRAIVTGEAIPMWTIAPDDLRNRQFLSFSPNEVAGVSIEIGEEQSFELVKNKVSNTWKIELPSQGFEFPAQTRKIDSFIRHASLMKIYKFPTLDWDQATAVHLDPPIARYKFWKLNDEAKKKIPLATLSLGRLNQKDEIIYASRMKEKTIFALQPVDGLSMPQNYYQLRDGRLFPSLDENLKITELHWTSKNADIKFTRSLDRGNWKGLENLENAVLEEFCIKLLNYTFDDWRGFGQSSVESFRISKPGDVGKGLKIALSDGSEKILQFGRSTPRRGIYTAVDFEEGTYIFDFSKDLIDTISAIDEIRLYFK